MTKIVICSSMLKPREVPVGSTKGDGSVYLVTSPTLFNDPVCDCKGYNYRGTCRHVKMVIETRCTWHQVPESDDKADELQKSIPVCPSPHCLLPTRVYELDPEFE